MTSLPLALYCTVQPAWVQTALNAAKFPRGRRTIQAGLPVAGSLNWAASPTGTAATAPILVPDGVPLDDGERVGPLGVAGVLPRGVFAFRAWVPAAI